MIYHAPDIRLTKTQLVVFALRYTMPHLHDTQMKLLRQQNIWLMTYDTTNLVLVTMDSCTKGLQFDAYNAIHFWYWDIVLLDWWR